MCTNKLQILNPIKPENRSGFDKLRLRVPCNKCKECLEQRQKDWLVRSYYEFQGFTGSAFLITLTYDEDHLPHQNGQPCFDYNHIKGFFKNIRHYLDDFRYLLTCEYGGFLHRPHYHVLFKFLNKVSYKEFVNVCNKYWKNGFVNYKEVSSTSMNVIQAISYITKYCSKDIDFSLDVDYRFRPRTQASIHYGKHSFSRKELEDGFIHLPLGKNGKLLKFAIPKYYYMKECYDYSYDKVKRQSHLQRNELGVDIAKLRHNRCYAHYVNSIFASKSLQLDRVDNLGYNLPLSWLSAVYWLFEDVDDFCEFVYMRDFITPYRPSHIKCEFDGYKRWYNKEDKVECGNYVYDQFDNTIYYRPRWYQYEQVCDMFDRWNALIQKSKHEHDKQELVDSSRARAVEKLKNNPKLFNYLRYVKDFNFETVLGIKV